MLALKIPRKEAEKWKNYLLQTDNFDTEYRILRDDEFIYYPIKDKFALITSKENEGHIDFVEKDFEKVRHKGTLKENLLQKLTAEELEIVNTAHDTIGAIAILEIPQGLEHREKIIAETLLEINPQIKTVLKKAASHEGTFRTQKMEYLAGENTKEAIYKENNIQLKLNVETVYFSPRLSTERKRISQQVKKGEDILVMFSGCAPYPVVLSKNTKARFITGIEINPEGQKYGLENLKLNKANNVLLINGDVRDIIPRIYQHIIGLKSTTDTSQMDIMLSKNPQIFEFFLKAHDLFEARAHLESQISRLISKGIQPVLHMPYDNKGISYSLQKKDIAKEKEMLDILGSLCKRYGAKAIIHVSNHNISSETTDDDLIHNIKQFSRYFDHFYFENLTSHFSRSEDIIRIGKSAGIKNICIDLCHFYLTYNDNNMVEDAVIAIQKEFNTYFHVVDTDCVTHTCALERGHIDLKRMIPHVNVGILEIICKDYMNPVEVFSSLELLKEYTALRKFDRILMPLPKTADEFLDEALLVSKKGTIIHFYDFLPEDNFDDALKKIDTACKSRNMQYRIIEVVRCGQHAPHVFRICVDFEIL